MKTINAIIAILGFTLLASAQDKLSDQDRELAENLQTVQESPDRPALENQIAYWQKMWSIIPHTAPVTILIGRVTVDPPDDSTKVVAQMEILKGGYFATQVKDFNHPLTFRMHGYQPLDLDFSNQKGELVDLGTIKLKKLSPVEQRTLKGRLEAEDTSNDLQPTVTLAPQIGPVNTLAGGYPGRSASHWQKLKLLVQSDGTFSTNGFSPIDYYLTIAAPGYVNVEESLSFDSPAGVDLGNIKLERPKKIQFTAMASTNLEFDLAKLVSTNLLAGSNWRYITDHYDEPFSKLSLVLRQANGELWFRSLMGPAQMSDLGPGTLEAKTKQVTGNEAGSKPESIHLNDGHVYLLKVGGKGTTWLLFKVEDGF